MSCAEWQFRILVAFIRKFQILAGNDLAAILCSLDRYRYTGIHICMSYVDAHRLP
jgi:hypothetical protein